MTGFLRRLSLQTKLVLSFAVVIVVAVVLGYVLINRSIDHAFGNFVTRTFAKEEGSIRELLVEYYQRVGRWEGLNDVPRPDGTLRPLLLADAEGRIVVSPDPRGLGTRASEADLEAGIRVVVDGETVGVVLPPRGRSLWSSQERGFLTTVRRALWIAGIVAIAIGLLLAFGVLRQVTGPLRRVIAATREVARGRLDRRVPESSSDELGDLARSFNEMAESLQDAERTKRRMIADISHELRTPMTALQTGLENLQDGVLETTPERLSVLHRRVLLTSRLVDDLQQLALADAGALSVHRRPTDLRALVAEILGIVGVQAEDAGIRLSSQLPSDLPAVDADPQRIEQVILNLLSNALRHTLDGGEIRIGGRRIDDRTVEVSVRNSGEPFSEAALTHVFDRFYRADESRSHGTGGSGLGLAIAKALVEAHGGEIRAENPPEGGVCIWFTLPRSE